jgi:hypothetical protein
VDHSFQRPGPDSDMQQPHGRLANHLHIFESMLSWLANLMQLTEAEQNDAGVYFGDPLTNTYQYSQDLDNKENYHGQ